MPLRIRQRFLLVLQPWNIMRAPDMHSWLAARVFIQRCYAYDEQRLCWPFGNKVRAANRTEMPELAGRRLKSTQLFFALQSTEMLAPDSGGRCKHCGMGFAASLAMTMNDGRIELIDFVFDGSA